MHLYDSEKHVSALLEDTFLLERLRCPELYLFYSLRPQYGALSSERSQDYFILSLKINLALRLTF